MSLPILLTAMTGSIYQIIDLSGHGEDADWLLDMHKGNFGSLKLEGIYPFLNALGLLFLLVTGILLLLNSRSNTRKRVEES
jgi:hypothetical protein